MFPCKKTIFKIIFENIRKIDSKEIAFRYFRGDYDGRTLPQYKVQTSNASVKLGKDIGRDSSSEIFRFTDRSNNNQSIVTTNHALYSYVMAQQDGKTSEMPILKCKYCKRSNLKKPIGLPIAMTLTNNKDAVFIVINSFCDFGCAFTYLKTRLSESRHYRGPLYMNSEQLLYCYYYRVYPDRVGQVIRDKADWDLLRENGGPLSNEEFDCETTEYVAVPSVITLPAKKQYLKINLKNARE